MEIFSVYDKKAELYGPLMTVKRDIEAIRSLEQLVNSKQESTLSQYPADFALYRFGSFDEETGNFKMYDNPVFVLDLNSLLIKLET